jgi:SAM-dependent methyltransferase
MSTEAGRYFRYLDLVREDIREEFDLVGKNPNRLKICDFGCGNGITTFGLAIEAKESECIGVDLFGEGSKITPVEIDQILKAIIFRFKDKEKCGQISELIDTGRAPEFRQENIVKNVNLPKDIDLAYCKKVLINIFSREYESIPSGENGLISGLRNINQCLNPDAQLLAIEYFDDFALEGYFERCGFQVERREQIKRREIRSKGRTEVESTMTLYLCRRIK